MTSRFASGKSNARGKQVSKPEPRSSTVGQLAWNFMLFAACEALISQCNTEEVESNLWKLPGSFLPERRSEARRGATMFHVEHIARFAIRSHDKTQLCSTWNTIRSVGIGLFGKRRVRAGTCSTWNTSAILQISTGVPRGTPVENYLLFHDICIHCNDIE